MQNRLIDAGVKGKTITLKIKKKRIGSKEPAKHLGHGIVDNTSSSITVENYINCSSIIFSNAILLFRKLRVGISPEDLRGIGLHISKLHDVDFSSVEPQRNLQTFFLPSSTSAFSSEVNEGKNDVSRLHCGSIDEKSTSMSLHGADDNSFYKYLDGLEEDYEPKEEPQEKMEISRTNFKKPKQKNKYQEKTAQSNSNSLDLDNQMTLSQIDESVFSALPPDIQAEIQRNVKKSSKSKSSASLFNESYKTTDSTYDSLSYSQNEFIQAIPVQLHKEAILQIKKFKEEQICSSASSKSGIESHDLSSKRRKRTAQISEFHRNPAIFQQALPRSVSAFSSTDTKIDKEYESISHSIAGTSLAESSILHIGNNIPLQSKVLFIHFKNCQQKYLDRIITCRLCEKSLSNGVSCGEVVDILNNVTVILAENSDELTNALSYMLSTYGSWLIRNGESERVTSK